MNIKDIPFEPQARPEHIETAKAFFENTENFRGVANFRIVFEEGHEDHLGKPCHANVGAAPAKPRRCIALYTGDSADTALYRKWLWGESFAARFVLAICDNGAVVSADIPAILMQNIAIMSRHCLEYSSSSHYSFPMFDDLYPKIGGDLSYVLSFNTAFMANSLDKAWSSPVLNGGGGHRAWCLFQLESLRNFLTGEFHFPNAVLGQLWTTYGGLYGGANLCKANPTYTTHATSFVQEAIADEDIRDALSEYRKSTTQGEMYRPPNPFARPTAAYGMRANDATFKEVVECIIPALKKKELIP